MQNINLLSSNNISEDEMCLSALLLLGDNYTLLYEFYNLIPSQSEILGNGGRFKDEEKTE